MSNNVKADRRNIDADKPSDSSLFITLFSDGSYCPDTAAWGCGIWLKCNHYPNAHTFAIGGLEAKDINEVEYLGIQAGLKHLKDNVQTKDKILIIQCDNMNALNRLDLLRVKLSLGLKHIKLKHVKGHSGNRTKRTTVNKIVDKLAYDEMSKWRGLVK